MNQTAAARPDQLTPAEITEKVLAGAVTRTTTPLSKQLPLAVLAGIYIGLGGLFSLLFGADPDMPFAMRKFMSGAAFSLGLSLVLVAGAELYTGATMIAAGAVDRRIRWGACLSGLARIWAGNLLGALLLVALVFASGVMKTGNLTPAVFGIAAAKLSPDWTTIMVKGILCNLLVCLGVWVGYAGRTVVDRCVGVLLPVSAFVALGFEHCIANMFFLPLAWALDASGAAPADFAAGTITLGAILKNITAATVGNTLAGMALALAYYASFGRRKA